MSDFFDYLDEKADIMRDLIQQLVANPRFQIDIDRIRSELGIDPNSKDREWTAELTILIAPHIDYLRKEYDLDWRWASFLRTFILTGKVDNITAGPITKFIMDEVTGKLIPHIAVFAETREEDVKITYREIHHVFGMTKLTGGERCRAISGRSIRTKGYLNAWRLKVVNCTG